jgi:6-phosphogluconolactonase (cycloisomerase 2 family)
LTGTCPIRAAFIRSEFDAPQNQQYLFSIEQSKNTIDAFAINSTTGAIVKAPGNPFADLNGPDAGAANPAGTFLFVANNTGSVSVFSIAASGALTKIAGSPFASSTGTEPAGISVSNDGTFLFVGSSIDVDTSSNSGQMDIFGISADGSLNLTSSVPSPAPPINFFVLPNSPYFYACGGSEAIQAYRIRQGTVTLTSALPKRKCGSAFALAVTCALAACGGNPSASKATPPPTVVAGTPTGVYDIALSATSAAGSATTSANLTIQ